MSKSQLAGETRYLFRRDRTWWVKLAVPRPLRGALGYDLRRSLHTHDLDEADHLCDEVLILNEGRALAQGPLDRVAAELEVAPTLVVRCAPDHTGQARVLVAGIAPGVAAVVVGPGMVEGHGLTADRVPDLVRRLATEGVDVFGIDFTTPSLEDLYFHLHRGGRSTPSPIEVGA